METKEKQKSVPMAKKRTASSQRTGERPRPSAGVVTKRPQSAKQVKQTPSPAKATVKKVAPAKVKVKKTTPRQPTPDVVYTEPGLFSRSKMILRLVTVVAVVLALIFGVSIFFKVETVTVAGHQKYTAAEIKQASGIRDGDNLLGLNNARITSNIIRDLPYVSKVRVGIKLPNTVKLEVVELDVVYSIEADDGSWWLIRGDGVVIEKTNSADAELHTKVLGVKLTGPVVGQKATAAQQTTQETTADGEPVPTTVNAGEQLSVAIDLMQYLEERGIIGTAASINVEDLADLQIWYGTRYQVMLGDTMDLKNKIARMKAAIDSASDTQTGILDVTFTVMPDQVICTPFGQ